MRFPFASGAKLKPKVRHPSLSTTRSDVLRTSLAALKESADGFPPLKSAVGGVVAIWDVAEGAKRSKADARDIAQRTEAILYVVADAIPDGSVIATPMLQSIERFTILLDEINGTMQQIAHAKTLSRVCHLNRNARTLADMRSRLDDAYRDFIAASTLRVEVKHERMNSRLMGLEAGVDKVSTVANDELAPQISSILFHSRLIVFLA